MTKLTRFYHHSLMVLTDPVHDAKSGQPVNQIRPIIEVLRRYLNGTRIDLADYWPFDAKTGRIASDALRNGFLAQLHGWIWTDDKVGGAPYLD